MSTDWKYRDPDDLSPWMKVADYVPELLLGMMFVAIIADIHLTSNRLDALALTVNAIAFEGVACPVKLQ